MAGEHPEKSDNGGDERNDYRSFNLALPLSMVALWTAFPMKPNVPVTGARPQTHA